MKVRLSDNAIRYRLSAADQKDLSENGNVSLNVLLPDRSVVGFKIEATSEDTPGLEVHSGMVILKLSKQEILGWLHGSENGYYPDLSVDEDREILSVALEKDLPCKH